MKETATTNPVLLQNLKPDFGQIVRQYPDAQHSFLRFQVGVNVDRPMREPRFEGKSIVGMFSNGRRVTVFKLLGFGETIEAAQRMAKGAK